MPNRWGTSTMVAQYELTPYTTIPTQKKDGSTEHVEYYSADEVNSGLDTWLSKVLSK